MTIVVTGPFAQAGGPTTVTVGQLLEWARAEGELTGFVQAGTYEVEVDRVDVLADALRPRYRVLSGESAGERFTGFKLNMTPRGVRRFAKVVRSWGVHPAADSTLEQIAETLRGRRALVRVTEETFRDQVFYDVQVVRLIEQ